MEIMKTVLLLIAVLTMTVSCTNPNRGTEVTNPQDDIVFTSTKHGFILTVPHDWSYIEYSDTARPADGVYSDPLGSAEVIAKFEKKRSNFVVLYDTLNTGESLLSYVTPRHQPDDVITSSSLEEDGKTAELVIVNQAATGPDGASVGFIYIATEGIIIALRSEIYGDTPEEKSATWNEFVRIAESLTL